MNTFDVNMTDTTMQELPTSELVALHEDIYNVLDVCPSEVEAPFISLLQRVEVLLITRDDKRMQAHIAAYISQWSAVYIPPTSDDEISIDEEMAEFDAYLSVL